MSKGENNMEVRVDLSYSTFLLSAKDAAIIASILANATRVSKEYDSAISGYKYELYANDSSALSLETLGTVQQAAISVQLNTTK